MISLPKILLNLTLTGALLTALTNVRAQEEVPTSSKLRKELFEMARPPIQEVAERPVRFLGSMKRLDNWVFFTGTIVDKEEGLIRVGPGESAETAILWVNRKGTWFVLEATTGFGDVVWAEWPTKHGAPAALFDQ